MSLKTLEARLQNLGGNQLQRLDKQKLESLRAALKNSYNTRYIKTDNHAAWPCLINTNSLKADYDKEYISIEHAAGLQAGDTFECLDDGSHWMIYLPVITETAYLRSEIIRCRYQLNVQGQNYWVYFQGPTETDLRWFIKNQINVNELNLSGTVYIKNDENTENYFKRFTHLKLNGHTWEVQVTDSISVPGILELEVQEYYDNSIAELPEIIQDETTPVSVIKGKTVVKPDSIVGFMVDPAAYDEDLSWRVEGNNRVKILETFDNGRMCKVQIFNGAIGTFKICYGQQFLEITVDWQRALIQGPTEVYPYDIHRYWIKNLADDVIVRFTIDGDQARIVSNDKHECVVEITTGKTGAFVLTAEYNDIQTNLPITINSL